MTHYIIVSLKAIRPNNFQTLQGLFLAVDRSKREMEVQGLQRKKMHGVH
jgi:hypothetical protein